MTLPRSFAHYNVTEKIGAGGMGEVYRASDSKLGRDVALKMLPPAFAQDAERMKRFQREAQVLAQLNHANIAAIYGLETESDATALVLELVEGPTLADRILEGPIAMDEALPIARQIAEAVEFAHEAGIIHRDLKPANVKITDDGRVKVLDFGLAKAYEENPLQSTSGSIDTPTIALTSPVITGALTGANVILGTAAYMSPEQARGKPVDKRSDVWSFGVVCFEMLTGRRLFEGETVSDTLAAVLKTDPDWDTLPADTPEPFRRLLQRCLEREPRKRLRDIGEARFRLNEWSHDPSSLEIQAPAVGGASPSARRMVIPWVLTVIVAAVGGFLWLGRPDPASTPPLRLEIKLPHQAELGTNSGVNIQLSPDGELLAYRTRDGIRVRPLDEVETTLLKDTDDVLQFTFSPDGQWIAFTGGILRRVSVDGGAPVAICDTDLLARGIAWVNPGTIVFTSHIVGGLSAVSLETGELRDLTTVDAGADERSHRWPTRLPDGRSVLFLCQFQDGEYDDGEIRIVDLDGGPATTVYRGGAAPRYSPSGHLLFAKDNTVFAIPIDLKARATKGLAAPVLSEVWARVNEQESDDGSAQYDVSPQGLLVYQTEPGGVVSSISSVDVRTKEVREIIEPNAITAIRVSPDGRRIAYQIRGEIHVLDLSSGGSSQLSFGGSTVRLGAWSPDSRALFWQSSVGDSVTLQTRPVDGSEPAKIIRSDGGFGRPTDVSPDGRWILLAEWPEDRGADEFEVLVQSLSNPEDGARLLVDEPNSQLQAHFSPDGQWFSYRSQDADTRGIYLRRFPDTGARWLVTGTDDNSYHEWLADGTGILFHDVQGTFRVAVDLSSGNPSFGRPVPLVPTTIVPPREAGNNAVTFAPDGATLYYLKKESLDGEDDSGVVLVTDWLSELEELNSH